MAIFHMSFSNISAGKGRSAIAGASYRSGEKLFDQKEGRSYFYARSVMPDFLRGFSHKILAGK